MHKVLYISSFQYSGSTLASFLLNTHSKIITIGHTTGWHFKPGEEFLCSCGDTLDKCPFYQSEAKAFAKEGLVFNFSDFGTDYRLANNDRLNRILTASLPLIQNSSLEKIRDLVIHHFPHCGSQLSQQDRANHILIKTALNYANANVFVDNSHTPYRLRHLQRIQDLELLNMYLIRDPRGAVYSCKKNKGWDVALSTQLWLRRQQDILRISREFPTLRVYYEDLATDVDKTLADIYHFSGLEAEAFTGNFKENEHHILGNVMRLRGGEVRQDTRWQQELSIDEQTTIIKILLNFAKRDKNHPLSDIVHHYLSH